MATHTQLEGMLSAFLWQLTAKLPHQEPRKAAFPVSPYSSSSNWRIAHIYIAVCVRALEAMFPRHVAVELYMKPQKLKCRPKVLGYMKKLGVQEANNSASQAL